MCSPEHNDTFLLFYPAAKIGGAQIRRCQGIAVKAYGFTLGALALSPSDFCDAGVDKGNWIEGLHTGGLKDDTSSGHPASLWMMAFYSL
jgi:hypothetical protein